ncbi:MAG: SMR family transporter [Xanthomonadales bacterium]|nr:SMR family transporter [Xanthomonadales bacterium]
MPSRFDLAAFGYILGCVLFTVYGQLIIKWRVSGFQDLPGSFEGKLNHVVKALLDPFILSGLAAAFVAVGFWILALSKKIPLSYAYPFTSMSFILVLLASGLIFGEHVSWQKVVGVGLIISGIAISASSPA